MLRLDKDQIIELINDGKNNGDFGYHEVGDDIYKKGYHFKFDDGVELLAFAGGTYVSIYVKKSTSEEWTLHCRHDSCWRYDGVPAAFKGGKKEKGTSYLCLVAVKTSSGDAIDEIIELEHQI